jgi:hypothetical protein
MDTDEQVQAMRRAATPEWKPEGPVDQLTIVWASEKRELFGRLEAHAKLIEELNERMRTLEAWACQLRREPTFFTEKPLSEHPLYRQATTK